MNLLNPDSQLSLKPLGAGDLIDRAVRFYRKNFWTFIWIAFPPVIIGTLFSVGWTILGRSIFSISSYNSEELVAYRFFTILGGSLIWLFETIAVLTVMGGASRNFVRHLLFGEPITFRETYKNTRQRVFGLIGASLLIAVLLGMIGTVIFYFGIMIVVIIVLLSFTFLAFSPFLSFAFSLILGLAVIIGTGWLFFLLASRFAYVPQVMLVEGSGVFAAIGRSINLASGNIKRFAALFIFTTVVTYSALALLYIPLGWYAWINGINILLNADMAPAGYVIASQVIGQISFILLMPIWMIGLCLLYVDERVRHEGYDIELMAARRLGDIPKVPQTYVNPLQPALSKQPLPPPPVQNRATASKSDGKTLDLS